MCGIVIYLLVKMQEVLWQFQHTTFYVYDAHRFVAPQYGYMHDFGLLKAQEDPLYMIFFPCQFFMAISHSPGSSPHDTAATKPERAKTKHTFLNCCPVVDLWLTEQRKYTTSHSLTVHWNTVLLFRASCHEWLWHHQDSILCAPDDLHYCLFYILARLLPFRGSRKTKSCTGFYM